MSKYSVSRIISACLTVLILCTGAFGAIARRTVDEQRWQELTREKSFSYKTEKELQELKETPGTENFFSKMIEAIFAFFASPGGKLLIAGLLIGALVYGIIRVILSEKSRLFARKSVKADTEEAESPVAPEDILLSDWEQQMQEAMRKQDLRQAVRLGYMLMLQLLARNNHLHYRADKTNYDYVYELTDKSLKTPFRNLSRQYEYAWYGDYPVKPEEMERYLSTINEIKNLLPRS
ncbi:MAG: DUF4129 domain-containing protein [Sphingobacteriales bacterium]|nr:MAG: DUF4129 domain-containing protein [Sphingobacteriales bacterium]